MEFAGISIDPFIASFVGNDAVQRAGLIYQEEN
jgi:hypothetical protein